MAKGWLPFRRTWILTAGLVFVYVAQCLWFLHTQSLTYDEPVHIAEGLDAWRNGRFEQYNDHPPLARLLCALPLVAERWQVDVDQETRGFRVRRIAPDPITLAWRARIMNVGLGVILAGLVWWVAGQLFSPRAANLALALYVFSAPLIAHFSVATTDGAATLLIFAAAVAVTRWRDGPSTRRTLLLGLVLGLLLLAKFSTPLMFALAVSWMVVPVPGAGPWIRSLWKISVTVGIAALVLWAGYFFHTAHLVIGDGQIRVTYPNRKEVVYTPVRTTIRARVWVPAGEYVEGLRNTLRHNQRGQPAFLLGQVSPTGGWKAYFPVVVLLKWPTAVLLLFLIAAGLVLGRRVLWPRQCWVMASFPSLYFVMSLFARFDLGDRHILPVYPFVILLASGVAEVARTRRLMLCLGAVVLLHLADGLRFAPDFLSYFNLLIRPAQSYQWLSDSNLDWGQGLLALRQYQTAHPGEAISLAYFGSVEPSVYGIRSHLLAEGEKVQGTVVVSATQLSGQYLENPASYRWLLHYPRVAILDHSLFVFHVPADASSQARTSE